MSITDELRKEANKADWVHCTTLRDIADRIDGEHDRAVMSVMNDALYHANDKNMAELGWVRLPKDADGMPIRVGDVMETDNGIREVDVLQKSSRKWSVGLVPVGGGVFSWHDAETLHHHHAPTVEDVLLECCHKYHSLLIDDMNDAINGVERDYIAPSEVIAEYAAKLRLAGDAE